MDTNDLTEKAYEILNIAEGINHLITVHIGALAISFSEEDEYLYAILELLSEIMKDPDGFIEDWDIAEEIDGNILKAGLERLAQYTKEVINIPIENRGITIEDKYFR